MEAAKLPPHDLEAEEAVLGCLLLDGQSIFKLAPFLKPQDFFREQNQWLYQACLDLVNRNEAVNRVSVSHELGRWEKLDDVGGEAYLAHLLATVPTPLYVEHYAQIVHRLSLSRQLITAAGQIAALGYEAGPDMGASLDRAEDILFRLRGGPGLRDFIPLRQLLDQYLEATATPSSERGQPLPQVFTGFAALDEWLGGLQRSDLIILGARPSQGKSSLALNLARNAAVEYNARVALFSLEMSREAVVERLLSAEADVDTRRLRLRLYNDEEERRLMDAAGKLSEAAIYVDDTPQLKLIELRSKARRLYYEVGVDLIILDYIGLVQTDGRRENRAQELGLISRSLKAFARELEVPVLAVSQLSRALEWRASHRPQLSDLRESGDLEQDADVVLFIYREEAYTTEEEWERQNPTKPYPKGIASILIAKHRNGPTGEINLSFVPRTAKFVDLQNPAIKKQGYETLPGFSS